LGGTDNVVVGGVWIAGWMVVHHHY
jgi:hypothetical protein